LGNRRVREDPGVASGLVDCGSAALVVLLFGENQRPEVQDRLIRLEEHSAINNCYPVNWHSSASLALGSTIALRFASDEELEGLIREVMGGGSPNPVRLRRP